jgi:hypothetical protein
MRSQLGQWATDCSCLILLRKSLESLLKGSGLGSIAAGIAEDDHVGQRFQVVRGEVERSAECFHSLGRMTFGLVNYTKKCVRFG